MPLQPKMTKTPANMGAVCVQRLLLQAQGLGHDLSCSISFDLVLE